MPSRDYWGSAGTLVSATLVASCCMGPVMFLLFGASFGALSALGALEPYRGWFIAAAVGFWCYGFYGLYIRERTTTGANCDLSCERPSAGARLLLWLALGVLVVAISYPTLAARWLG